MNEVSSFVNVLYKNPSSKANGFVTSFADSSATAEPKTFIVTGLSSEKSQTPRSALPSAKSSTVSKFKPMPTSASAVETFQRVVEKLKICKTLLNEDNDYSCQNRVDTSCDISQKTTGNAQSTSASCEANFSQKSEPNEAFCCNHDVTGPTTTINAQIYKLDLSHQDCAEIKVVQYENETQIDQIMSLITKDLSEPYSIYTYRYFIHNWPYLCFIAKSGEQYVGAIICKLSLHGMGTRRGYIAMLAVDENFRRRKIGTRLVARAIEEMIRNGCDEVVLETEVTNKSAMSLYENLGFVRDKRLFRYYLNGVDAFRLKLWLKSPEQVQYL